jgi:mono/diheme cytochrome c family protein
MMVKELSRRALERGLAHSRRGVFLKPLKGGSPTRPAPLAFRLLDRICGEESQMSHALSRATKTLRAVLPVVVVLALLAFSAAAQVTGPKTPALIIPSMYGQDLFNFYCASCHGRDGRGRGPVVPALTVPPPDLTSLAARHGGMFPTAFVEAFVTGNGTPMVPAHGSKDMPVWGPIFLALDPAHPTANRVRVENIVSYIESIQKKP